MTDDFDLKLESLSRFIIKTPSSAKSIGIVIFSALFIEFVAWLGQSMFGDKISFFSVSSFLIPAIIAFVLTPPAIGIFHKKLSNEWSGLIVLISFLVSVIITLNPFLILGDIYLPSSFAISIAAMQAVRLLLLSTVADYHISRMLIPASIQSFCALFCGTYYFGKPFFIFALILTVFSTIGVIGFILIIEYPMKKSFGISPLGVTNAFLAHLAEGSKKLNEYFREIGEEVCIPNSTLFFSRKCGSDIIFTAPNLHPGPMGEVGGSNLPKILHDTLGEGTLVSHGCSTHDYNPVEESEISKISESILLSKNSAVFFKDATHSIRMKFGSVIMTGQAFGDSALLIGTRSPLVTEDLDPAIGIAIMESGKKYFKSVLMVDAHNCMTTLCPAVSPCSQIALEYYRASEIVLERLSRLDRDQFNVGYSRISLPFGREKGFGDLGVQVMMVSIGEEWTGYILLDGNNMLTGVRDEIQKRLGIILPMCEVMTTDTHVVNLTSGKNQIGAAVPLDLFYPYIEEAVIAAKNDALPSEVAATTAWCNGIVVFGSQRISQIAATVTALAGLVIPVAAVILILIGIATAVAFQFLS